MESELDDLEFRVNNLPLSLHTLGGNIQEGLGATGEPCKLHILKGEFKICQELYAPTAGQGRQQEKEQALFFSPAFSPGFMISGSIVPTAITLR